MKVIMLQKVEDFIATLEPRTFAEVYKDIGLLEEYGYLLNMPHCKKITQNLYELRTQGKLQIRVFYGFYKGDIYLVHGIIKKSQKLPYKEISKALKKLKSALD